MFSDFLNTSPNEIAILLPFSALYIPYKDFSLLYKNTIPSILSFIFGITATESPLCATVQPISWNWGSINFLPSILYRPHFPFCFTGIYLLSIIYLLYIFVYKSSSIPICSNKGYNIIFPS